MSQEVMNELVNMSQEIIKLKDQRRELLDVLVDVMFRHVPFSNKADYAERARAAISKAESAQ